MGVRQGIKIDDQCRKCGLRCKVHFPGKKVPYSESNCPREKLGAAPLDMNKRMPMLAKFNDILIDHGREPITGEW